jgi:antitoxin (DNA-binding transcriptional repressor) of toxin-antitoxin stability system
MTKTVDITEAQKSLPELVDLASKGNDIIISRGEQPVARLVPVGREAKTRTPGLNRGQAWISPDFDDPLPDDFWNGENDVLTK